MRGDTAPFKTTSGDLPLATKGSRDVATCLIRVVGSVMNRVGDAVRSGDACRGYACRWARGHLIRAVPPMGRPAPPR